MYKKNITSCILTSIFGLTYSQTLSNISNKTSKSSCRCLTSEVCWPDSKQWDALAKSLKGKLIKPTSIFSTCEKNSENDSCKSVLQNMKNPFYM